MPKLLQSYAGAERRPPAVRPEQKRKLRRRPTEGYAWVLLDSELVKCGLLDLTSKGARLVSRYVPLFHPSFGLYLKPDRGDPRSCHIVWRRGTECGVAFGGENKSP